jgi:ribosome-binding factor A
LSSKVEEAVEFLAYGVEVEKYCFGTEKVEDVYLCFSEDIQFAGVYVTVKERMDILPMSECTEILAGLKTSRFQFYQENGYPLTEEKCFSLIFNSRSYDFVAHSETARDKLINNLKFLREAYKPHA